MWEYFNSFSLAHTLPHRRWTMEEWNEGRGGMNFGYCLIVNITFTHILALNIKSYLMMLWAFCETQSHVLCYMLFSIWYIWTFFTKSFYAILLYIKLQCVFHINILVFQCLWNILNFWTFVSKVSSCVFLAASGGFREDLCCISRKVL